VSRFPRPALIDRNKEAGRTLAAKPPAKWTDADTLTAGSLLMKYRGKAYDSSPMVELENAMGAAPARSFPAALAKIGWLIEQPGGELPDWLDWEPAAYRTLRDFLSPKDDYVAELGVRMGRTIRRAQLADSNFHDPTFHTAIRELEAIDGLIEASVPTSLQGVTTQLVVAMGHLENLRVMTESDDDADVVIHADDIHDFVERTKGLLDAAVPVLAAITGIDLKKDLAADYRVMSLNRGEPPDDAPVAAADDANETLKEAA
jgi:hypothetical protein